MYCKWGNDRAMLAQKYGVAGASGGCNGYLLMCCCASCALIQELNHIKANANKPFNTNTIIVAQAQPQPQMVMQQQQQYPPRS